MHAALEKERKRVDLLHEGSRRNEAGTAGHHELHPLRLPAKGCGKHNGVRAGEAYGHKHGVDSVLIGEPAKFQLGLERRDTGRLLSLGRTAKWIAGLRQAPMKPQGFAWIRSRSCRPVN